MVNKTCYFLQRRKFCNTYVSPCDTRQHYSYPNKLPEGFLNSIKTEVHLKFMGLDFIDPYPTTVRHWCCYCFVVPDYFSKWVEVLCCNFLEWLINILCSFISCWFYWLWDYKCIFFRNLLQHQLVYSKRDYKVFVQVNFKLKRNHLTQIIQRES